VSTAAVILTVLLAVVCMLSFALRGKSATARARRRP
jgi:hypothetical protein